MACLSSRSFTEDVQLAARTRAKQHAANQRSALPPAPTSSQLLSILNEAAHLLMPTCAADTALQGRRNDGEFEARLGGFPGVSPSSDYAAYVRRQCPTSRRVQSSFAAAGAHSVLGEMLQLFALALTRLFTEGITSASVVSFPAEWDRRLNAPEAADLREKYLYELQGFSTLFTYVWGNVAAACPCVLQQQPPQLPDEKDVMGEGNEQKGVTVLRASPAAATDAAVPVLGSNGRSPAPPQLGNVSLSTSDPTAQQTLPVVPSARSWQQACLVTAPSKLTTFHSPSTASVAAGRTSEDTFTASGQRRQSAPQSNARPAAKEAIAPSHRFTSQGKLRGHFLPLLPLEGLVPSGQLPAGETKQSGEVVERADKVSPQVASTLRTNSLSRDAELPQLSRSARQLAIQQAMEHDREQELKRKLGVRRVRNYAKEEDMLEYVHAFQQNMRSVLDGDDDRGGEDADSGDIGKRESRLSSN